MYLATKHRPWNQDQEEFKRGRRSKYSKWWIAAISTVAFTTHYLFGPAPMIKPAPATFEACLIDLCAGRPDCVRFSAQRGYEFYINWARPFNLARSCIPTAVIRPKSTEEVAGAVKCAAKHGIKVQARSGGHSFANHGLGGKDGALSIDLVNLQYVEVNTTDPSWHVKVGAGTRLSQVDEALGPHQRAFPHGVCPGVGIGGHATIGGLGPMSRMWGSCLDHIEEVEVVTASGTVLRADTIHNSDLFFALRGAGAGFGIITQFTMRTHPTPKEVLHYTYNFQFSRLTQIVELFDEWQNLVADPTLDRRLGTEFTLYPLGARVTATWYGTKGDLEASKILDRLPSGNDTFALRTENWGQSLINRAIEEALHISDIPNKFFSKSLGFTRNDIIPKEKIADLFKWVEDQNKGTYVWFIIFDATGGAVSDVPTDATAYAHRDKFMFYQSYAVNALQKKKETRDFLDGFHNQLLNVLPGDAHGTYPGYVDPDLERPQETYWMGNLPALERIKGEWDPNDIFHNPQSVRPRVLRNQ